MANNIILHLIHTHIASINTELGLPWFCLCLFVILILYYIGYSQNNLKEKIERIEKKLELMFDEVTQLTSENDDLKQE